MLAESRDSRRLKHRRLNLATACSKKCWRTTTSFQSRPNNLVKASLPPRSSRLRSHHPRKIQLRPLHRPLHSPMSKSTRRTTSTAMVLTATRTRLNRLLPLVHPRSPLARARRRQDHQHAPNEPFEDLRPLFPSRMSANPVRQLNRPLHQTCPTRSSRRSHCGTPTEMKCIHAPLIDRSSAELVRDPIHRLRRFGPRQTRRRRTVKLGVRNAPNAV